MSQENSNQNNQQDSPPADKVLEVLQEFMASTFRKSIAETLKTTLSEAGMTELLTNQLAEKTVPNTPDKTNKDNSPAVTTQNTPQQASRIYGKDWVVMQNDLLYAISNLTLDERRLIMYLSPLVRKAVDKNPNQRQFFVRATDFAEVTGVDKKNAYKTLEKIGDSMMGKKFTLWNFYTNSKEVDSSNEERAVHWLGECGYRKGKGGLDIELTSSVIAMLTVFDKTHPYTKYQGWLSVNLNNYAIILFELVMSCMYQDFKMKTWTVDYLREKFNCVDSYPKIAEFKRNVIDRAINEIESHTPVRLSYTQKRTGRIVTELVFSFEDTSGGKLTSPDYGVGKDADNATLGEDEEDNDLPFGIKMEDVKAAEIGVVIDEAAPDNNTPSPALNEAAKNTPKAAQNHVGASDEYESKKHAPDPYLDTPDVFDELFITPRQRIHFARKLSRLVELSHLAKGEAGRDYNVFAQQIAEELKDPERQKYYKPYLDMVGFKKSIRSPE